MKKITALGGVAFALALMSTATASADAVFKITETYIGIDGEDGTVDWFEVTNFGDMAGDTGTLRYDDVNPQVGSSRVLNSFILAPGQSAVFMIESAPLDGTYANSIAEFTAIWGAGITVGGLSANGAGLGQTGDTVNIGFDNGGTFQVVDSLVFGDVGGAFLRTMEDPTGMGTPSGSILGQNGAYESNSFFNDNVSDPDNTITLIGSPGVVPEPATMSLLAIGAVALLRRRK